MKHLAYQQCSRNPNQFTLCVYQAENKSLSRLASLATPYPKIFFVRVRRNRQVISMKTNLGVIVKGPEAQAELLNKFYYTVFRPDNGQPNPIP